MREHANHIKKVVWHYAALAHEEELRGALEALAAKFDQCGQGPLSSGGLSEALDELHQGPSRAFFKWYNEPSPLDMAVAQAIVIGVLDERQIESGLLDHLASVIQFYRETN
jgi:hypothetical protein